MTEKWIDRDDLAKRMEDFADGVGEVSQLELTRKQAEVAIMGIGLGVAIGSSKVAGSLSGPEGIESGRAFLSAAVNMAVSLKATTIVDRLVSAKILNSESESIPLSTHVLPFMAEGIRHAANITKHLPQTMEYVAKKIENKSSQDIDVFEARLLVMSVGIGSFIVSMPLILNDAVGNGIHPSFALGALTNPLLTALYLDKRVSDDAKDTKVIKLSENIGPWIAKGLRFLAKKV